MKEKRDNIDAPQMGKWWWWIATWFGCGLSPVMSGTAGSIGALPFAYAIQAGVSAHFGSLAFGNLALFAASMIMFLIGWRASVLYLKATGRTDDPREIVVDEVAAQWLVLAVLFPTWHSYLVGLVAFRLFDIVKPWPVSVADRDIHGGFGVMFDDLLAALYPIVIYLFLLVEAQLMGSQSVLQPYIHWLSGDHVH